MIIYDKYQSCIIVEFVWNEMKIRNEIRIKSLMK